ncbi:hypothetical protein AZE42_02264 [Rhizopogon vesiculosus]|uniref:Initiator tRNA phosphoribosyl transferase n=1 Tax=Rhizopogon vesiculosus TaxID=180088 RepID=A0A1J8QHK2_9AGAM|nr:hypothetical protein AZE42_02264 [Rhizopogon vesiculosus]
MGRTDGAALAFSELRKESQDIHNRIHSIAEDAAFVDQVRRSYPSLPLIPNMRCGAWYTDPETVSFALGPIFRAAVHRDARAQASEERAYFKSTDGHTGNWSFNLRRPNLHVLPLICTHAGLLLVDSTRAGKRMPDALSKTVPIWCAVINRVVLKTTPDVDADAWNTRLYTPPGVVSAQEHDQIEQRLDGWADDLAASFYVLPRLKYPLRPIWITPSTTVFPRFSAAHEQRFYPIICISASKQVLDGVERRVTGFAYIQGSGDDHELWSMGLTPTQFWKYKTDLLRANRPELPVLVQSLISSTDTKTLGTLASSASFHPIPIHHVRGQLSVCTHHDLGSSLDSSEYAVVYLSSSEHALKDDRPARLLCIQTPQGKRGQHHFLHTVLPQAMSFIALNLEKARPVCVACETGTDLGIGVTLAALAKFFDEEGEFHTEQEKNVLSTSYRYTLSNKKTIDDAFDSQR